TRFSRDWSSDVCSSDLRVAVGLLRVGGDRAAHERAEPVEVRLGPGVAVAEVAAHEQLERRVAAPPVAPGGALVALGRVTVAGVRSEERRVGKEGRAGGR